MSPEHANQQSLAAGAVSAELSPAGGACKVPKVDRKKLTPAPSKVDSLRGLAHWTVLASPVLGAWAWIIISSPSDGETTACVWRVQLLAAAGCTLQRRAAPFHEVNPPAACVGSARPLQARAPLRLICTGASLNSNFTPLLPPPSHRPLTTGPSSHDQEGHRLSRTWHTGIAAYAKLT